MRRCGAPPVPETFRGFPDTFPMLWRFFLMSSTYTGSQEQAPTLDGAVIDMKLEVVVIPVSDVDRAKEFYARLGWRLDADVATGDDFRLVQFTPPGSGCSVQFGTNLTSSRTRVAQSHLPGRLRHRRRARRSWPRPVVEVTPVFHCDDGLRLPVRRRRPHPVGSVGAAPGRRAATRSFASFSDPDGNTLGLPGGHHPAARSGRPSGDDVRVGGRPRRGVAAGGGSARRARGTDRAGGHGLAGLVRRVHGA